ncbi:bifunctional phosphatase/dolichol-phosphate glucosyltransferase [Thermococcus kodakarensis KOD1]|uniref:Bifunctional phosphatase/dolichol-phosphate glucosyltransferase n=1 Tax=Thermococcus kodakarensis (strain ATCC BAA-918 / JCM 12380 / KOD1) TaxID=69014 RepID=Q5JHS2_THEKO|nr:HAD-IA family hydrolase [Thermococcus kodakarensis]WCN28082.1 HAD-IA family hydrolase [Thermococcus kodakarensis]WCN30379.1 HAD-IA family hydrolase [Thermococcus kodakarensis]BAD86444.1 bifunctional phosphatase/dolichol-phosphate glucosyltransferase [Thermococcus kodakarensis KOD1]
MDIRLVVFDLDGTLIGAPKAFSEVKEELRKRLLERGISEELIGDLTPMYETLIEISEKTGIPFDELHSIQVELETERMKDAFLFKGVRESLEFLREKGIRMAVVTRSSRDAALFALQKTGIADYFDVIVAREDVPPDQLKPNGGQIKRVLDALGVPPEKTLVVGDHGYDVIAAKNAGALSLLVTSHDAGRMSFSVEATPNFEIPTMEHFIPLMGRLLSSYVVVPAYNEEKTIGSVLTDLLRYFRREEIVVVNDGSKDRTEEIARSFGVHVLTHLVNRGLGGALGTGLAYAVRKGAKMILTFDADGQHLIGDALKVMKPVAEGKADFAVGSRLKGDTSQMPFIKKFGNFVLDFITALFARKYVSDSQSGLRCFSGECAAKIKITCDRYAVSSEIIIEAVKNGCRIVEVPIKAVYTEYSMRKGTNVLEGVKIALNLLFDKLR